MSAPTISAGCSEAFFRMALKWTWAPALDISRRKSLAKVPSWMSERIFFMVFLVSSVMSLGPVI